MNHSYLVIDIALEFSSARGEVGSEKEGAVRAQRLISMFLTRTTFIGGWNESLKEKVNVHVSCMPYELNLRSSRLCYLGIHHVANGQRFCQSVCGNDRGRLGSTIFQGWGASESRRSNLPVGVLHGERRLETQRPMITTSSRSSIFHLLSADPTP